MVKYLVKRILYSLLILFGVSLIIYTMVRLLPTDYVDSKFLPQLSSGTVKQEDIDRMKELYGLADTSFLGILKGYFSWLGGLFRLDLGVSFTYGRPVGDVIKQYMGTSFAISLVALILQFGIAIPLGIKSAVNQYGKTDYATTVVTMLGISLPSYFLAAILIKLLSVNFGIFPASGLLDATTDWSGNPVGAFFNRVYHLILPITVVVVLGLGSLMRYTRTNMLEVINADYIRTARAKGLPENSVIFNHAFKNTLIPLVTIMAGILPSLFGGSILIEKVFNIPGIGQKAYKALTEGDIPFIMGYNMFLAVLTVIGALLSDLMYGIVDPRVRIMR